MSNTTLLDDTPSRPMSAPDSERLLALIPKVEELTGSHRDLKERLEGLEDGFSEHQQEHRDAEQRLDLRLGKLSAQIEAVPGLVAIALRQSEHAEREDMRAARARQDSHSQRFDAMQREVAKLASDVRKLEGRDSKHLRRGAVYGGGSGAAAVVLAIYLGSIVCHYLGIPLPALPALF